MELTAATTLTALWAVSAYYFWQRDKLPKHQPAAPAASATDTARVLIAYASQSGQARELATEYARQLVAPPGNPASRIDLRCLSQLAPEDLAQYQQVFLHASTYGQGQAPDTAKAFCRALSAVADNHFKTGSMQFAVLALGDRAYPDFCAFGHWLHQQLLRLAGEPLADCIEVDRLDSGALRHWQGILEASFDCQLALAPKSFRYRLTDRRLLNPGSQNARLFWLQLEAVNDSGTTQHPQPGDLIDIHLTNGERRSYSLANAPAQYGPAQIELIVRQHYRDDRTPGYASHYLSERVDAGSQIKVSLRRGFDWSLIPAHCPLLLIGAGSGLAGVRAGLQARQQQPLSTNWLIFGERDPVYDRPCEAELMHYLELGVLSRCDRVWSQAAQKAPLRYVQDVLRSEATQLTAYLLQGGYIYVCGSADGLGAGVHDALLELLGESVVSTLQAQGRYVRDIY
ncbi:MAG: flavodoxin domain-containing protein [Idiomarina sp.]|nr:flavodoxin domain-containing protein [Idiomarina sp.]